MGKFDKMLKKMPQVDNKKAAREALEDFKVTIEEGIAHYEQRALLKDWWQPHYENSAESWKRKLEKVNKSLQELDASVPPVTGTV